MTYVTAFSVAEHPLRNWWFPAFSLVFVAIGLVWVLEPNSFAPFSRHRFQRSRFFRWFFFLFGCALTSMVAAKIGMGSYRAIRALRSGDYQTVEGKVSNFIPAPVDGHQDESFDVKGVRFAYSDNMIITGFHQTASHGGPIREGLAVRVAYKNGEIIKLEVSR